MCFSQKYLVHSTKWRVLARCLGGCIFSYSRGNFMFFLNIVFDIFWPKYKFGLCIKTWRRGFSCLWLFFYTSKRVSLCTRYGFFCYTIANFVPFGVIENKVTKINFKYFNGNCEYSSYCSWSVLFLYAPAHEDIVFWTNYLLS